RYQTFAASWAEQRAYIDTALAALDGTALANQARAALRRLEPARPSAAAMQRVAAPSEAIVGAQLSIAIDAQTGAIAQLTERATGRIWADPQHLLALLRYQTFAQADYDRFRRQYSINKRTTAAWAVPDFTKPGMAASGAEPRW